MVVAEPTQLSNGVVSKPNRDGYNTTDSESVSSTRLIESLHEQVDALTQKNLALTSKTQEHLSQLEAQQQRETKLTENTAMLKHERENLISMLGRKSRKLADLEKELEKLRDRQENLQKERQQLQERRSKLESERTGSQQKIEALRAQHRSIIDSSAENTRTEAIQSVNTLESEWQLCRRQLSERILYAKQQNKNRIDRINEMISRIDRFEKARRQKKQAIITKFCDNFISDLKLNHWITLYKESKNLLRQYSEHNNLELPASYTRLTHDLKLNALETRLINTKRPSKGAKTTESQNNRISSGNTTSQNSSPSLTPTTSTNPFFSRKKNAYRGDLSFSPRNATLPNNLLPGVKRSASCKKT